MLGPQHHLVVFIDLFSSLLLYPSRSASVSCDQNHAIREICVKPFLYPRFPGNTTVCHITPYGVSFSTSHLLVSLLLLASLIKHYWFIRSPFKFRMRLSAGHSVNFYRLRFYYTVSVSSAWPLLTPAKTAVCWCDLALGMGETMTCERARQHLAQRRIECVTADPA